MLAAGATAHSLSHEQHLVDASPHWVPHLMFFYDGTQSAAAWGVSELNGTTINGSEGDDDPLDCSAPVVRRHSGRAR
jgi:hypothetical protein